MWEVRYTHNWGSRQPRWHTTKFFTRKPTQREIIKAFAEEVTITPGHFKPECSGLIIINKIKVEF